VEPWNQSTLRIESDSHQPEHNGGNPSMIALVVDDDELYRLLLRDLMVGQGWDVLLARNGEEALQKLKAFAVDLVISDIYMPVIDGLKLHHLVRAMESGATIPFLFVSGYSDEHTSQAVKDPRYDRFFRKGSDIRDLLRLVKALHDPRHTSSLGFAVS